MITISFSYYLILFLLVFKIYSYKELNNITNSPNIAVIPFKTFYQPFYQEGIKPFGAKDYFNIIHNSNSYLEFEIGKNN